MKNTHIQPPAPQREALPMQVDVKIHSLHASGSVLADASVNLNGCFAIRGVKVVDGSNGPFVSSSEEIPLHSVSAPRGRAKTPPAPFLPPLPTEAHGGRASAGAL